MKHPSTAEKQAAEPFLSDVKTLRERARQHIERGVVSGTYVGNVARTIEILQTVLATEIVCVLRYTQHSIAATGLASEGVKAEFAQHAKEEQEHAMAVAERISQLGGKPNFDPKAWPPVGVAIYRLRPGRHDPRKPDRRTDRRRPLPGADPLLRR